MLLPTGMAAAGQAAVAEGEGVRGDKRRRR